MTPEHTFLQEQSEVTERKESNRSMNSLSKCVPASCLALKQKPRVYILQTVDVLSHHDNSDMFQV